MSVQKIMAIIFVFQIVGLKMFLDLSGNSVEETVSNFISVLVLKSCMNYIYKRVIIMKD